MQLDISVPTFSNFQVGEDQIYTKELMSWQMPNNLTIVGVGLGTFADTEGEWLFSSAFG